MASREIVKEPHLRELADGVYAWIGAYGNSNAGAVETPRGLVVYDSQQHVPLAHQFRAALKKVSDKPVEMLVNSHFHLDHIAGNVVFGEEAPIYAHEKTMRQLEQFLGPKDGAGWVIRDLMTKIQLFYGTDIADLIPEGDPALKWFRERFAPPEYDVMEIIPPTHTFADRFQIHLAEEVASFDYYGPGHCDGDLVFNIPGKKIAFLADLLFEGRFPWIGNADLNGWIGTLERILELDLDCVVPGHGVPVGLQGVSEFRGLLISLRDRVADALKGGATEDEAAMEVRLPNYADMPRYNEWLGFNVRNAYRYLNR